MLPWTRLGKISSAVAQASPCTKQPINMQSFALMSVVLGVASCAPQVFPRHAPLDAARQDFIREYNRLAQLAAAAPDIHIIMGATHRLNNVPSVPVVNNHIAEPVTFTQPQGTENFGFTSNFGLGQQFVHTTGHLAGHQAGHLAGHQAPATPSLRWTGPFADTVPAGVHGLPTQVRETADVQAAKAAHFAAHSAALHATGHNVRRF